MALILTGSSSDTITATTSSDIIYSGSGNDTIIENLTGVTGFDLIVGGSGTDTLKVILTQAMYDKIMTTNLVSAFNASASSFLQIFNFSAYNSLLGFDFNIITQGVEKLVFQILNPNVAPTAVDAVYNTNEDAGLVSVDLKSVMNVSDDAGVANVHVQSVVFASGEALAYSVVGDTLQFDANQYNSLLATNSVNPVLNVTFVDAGGLTVTKALTVHVQGVNDAPVANVDSFVAVDDSISASVINVANLLTNDTDPDSGDTKVVTSISNFAVSGYGYSNVVGLGDPIHISDAPIAEGSDVVAEFILTPLGVFNNNGGDAADLILYKDGHIELVKGSAFDFLPAGEHLTISGSYTMQDSSGAMSSSTFSFDITGVDGNDVLVGTNGDDTLNGGVGNDLIYGGLGADTIDGGAGVDTLSYADRTSGIVLAYGFASAFPPVPDSIPDGDTFTSIEHFIGTSFNDTMAFSGLNNITVDGGSGNDTIMVISAGNNTINGGAGNDTLNAGDGNDILNGGDGNDVLNGAGGNNALTGGGNADIFAFNGPILSPAYHSTITDFNVLQGDALQFSLVIDYNGNGKVDDLDAIFTTVTNDGVNTTFDDGNNHLITINGVYSSFASFYSQQGQILATANQGSGPVLGLLQ